MNKKDIKQIEIENNRLITKLNKDNYRAYDNISIYLDLDDEIDLSKKIIKNDIVKMIYEGQVRGQSWDEIIGDDYKKFADEVISTRKNLDRKARFLYMIRNIFMMISLIFVLTSLPIIFTKYDFIEMGVKVPITTPIILLIYIIYAIVISKENVTKEKKVPKFDFLEVLIIGVVIQLGSIGLKHPFHMNYILYFGLFIITTILFIIISVVYNKEKINLIN